MSTRTAHTLEDVRREFAKQLAESPKCDGDYLNGATIEEMVDILRARHQDLGILDTDTPKLRRFVEQRIAEWRAHVGEALLFVIIHPEPNRLEVTKVWESELPTFIGRTFEAVDFATHKFPRMVP